MKKQSVQSYVFRVSFLSAKGDGSWVERLLVRQNSFECKSDTRTLAFNIASHHLTATERGVKVDYLGIQLTDTKGKPLSDNVTAMGCISVILTRDTEKPLALTHVYGHDGGALYVNGRLVCDNYTCGVANVLGALGIRFTDSRRADLDWYIQLDKWPEQLSDCKFVS